LDYGGLIVAAQDYHQYSSNPSSNLKYSCDMGSSWSTFSFSSSNAVIFGVITEPGEATTVVSLYGVQNHAWTVFTVNLTNIFTRACSSGDFYTWRPYDINSDTGCLLGAAVSIERRVPSICCLTGVNYVREISYSICGCTGDDFECDYGYAHANGITGPCVKDTSVELPDPCAGGLQTYQKSQGYVDSGSSFIVFKCHGSFSEVVNSLFIVHQIWAGHMTINNVIKDYYILYQLTLMVDCIV
jgi:hypothetical protein